MPEKELLLRKVLVKFIYASMLLEFPAADVIKFWDKHPLNIGNRIYRGTELFRLFWKAEGFTPAMYNVKAINSLEAFYVQKGKNIIDCYRKALLSLGSGTGWEPQYTLWAFQPVLKFLIGGGDFYKGLCKASTFVNAKTAPGSFLGPVGLNNLGDGRHEAIMAFANDMTFSTPYLPFDAEIHMPQIFLMTSFRFGFPPFESYDVLADLQPAIDRIDASLVPRIKDGLFVIQGNPYGKVTTFYNFIDTHGIHLKPLKPPDAEVVHITKEYYCPVRKRVVLHKGAVYGAPIFLFSLTYRPKVVKPSDPKMLGSLADELMFPLNSKWTEAEQKHYALLKSLATPINAQYDKSSEAVTVNGKFITSGVQARILRKIMNAHVHDGRTEFERREFVADETLISDPFNPGFALRLKRIVGALDRADCGVRIVRHARGRFILQTDGEFKYTER